MTTKKWRVEWVSLSCSGRIFLKFLGVSYCFGLGTGVYAWDSFVERS